MKTHTYTKKERKTKQKKRSTKKSFITVLKFVLSSIYIYGFQSFGDDGLREFDEAVDDEDEDDGNDDEGLAELIIDE